MTRKTEYSQTIRKILQYIKDGDVYQINYTFKKKFKIDIPPLLLYRELRKKQKVEYGSFLHFNNHTILSLSPELFFKKQGTKIYSKPMKGTAPRGKDKEEDESIRDFLKHDPKNKAENVMIVDLIRNDIGRIANPNTVQVKNLFDVEKYETLFQMISTVEGHVDKDIPLLNIFKSLFPCGSVTGAPKIRAMEIIKELEKEARNVYTGAIGYMMPNNDMCFNVPIRTLLLKNDGKGEIGIGSGIVYDSIPEEEYKECLLKAKFLEDVFN